MLLMLVRHADAGEPDAGRWPDDRLRPLTDEGRDTVQAVSRGLLRLNLAPDAILTSPWRRAAETATLLAQALGVAAPPIPCEPLTAPPDLARLADCVGEAGARPLAMVGHSPWLEELAGLLLVGSTGALRIALPKGGVLGISTPALTPGAGTLRFLFPPAGT